MTDIEAAAQDPVPKSADVTERSLGLISWVWATFDDAEAQAVTKVADLAASGPATAAGTKVPDEV